jgi:hypothetical protein
VLLVLLPLLPWSSGGKKANGAALLADSVEALSQVKSIHIRGRIRSVPGDNFELIGTDYDFIPIEIWREYADPPRWRIEKPGRVVTMNGQASLLYIGKTNSAMKGSPRAGFVEWLRPMLDPQAILETERAAAEGGEAQAVISESNGVITAILRRAARGDFENDWARNKSVPESDHYTVYRFDRSTKRLQGVQVIVTVDGRETTVAEFDGFRYNDRFPDALFNPQLPPDANWLEDPAANPAIVKFAGAKEVALYLFDALSREDWDAVLSVTYGTRVTPVVKQVYGRLHVLSVGEPFRSGLYPGWFVPYEVRLREGRTKSFRLAVRNDNPAGRWMVDGGL